MNISHEAWKTAIWQFRKRHDAEHLIRTCDLEELLQLAYEAQNLDDSLSQD